MTKATQIEHITIVGGGTAGWMAANMMAKCWHPRGIKISLVESPNIGTVGVGEGSTPQLKHFFDFMGIREHDWMPKCHATYKNGITFSGWSTRPGYEHYFHSFESEVDFRTQPAFFFNCDARRKGVDVDAHPDSFYLGSYLTRQRRGPIPAENFPFQVGYGYHFDSSLVGQYLCHNARSLGVNHISAEVADITLNSDGAIDSLRLDTGEILSADLFVDCTGFTSLLLQKTLKVPFVSYSDNLFNDSAVTIQTPAEEDYQPHTVSTALKNGWVWKIPLTSRIGNGYVYSSRYCSSEAAEQELRQHLQLHESEVPARHLTMKVGRVDKHWHKNCVAVGLSQGFIEPLEATALHIVQETVQGFIDAYELGDFTAINRDKFNQRINARFEGVRDYIVAHYALNSRIDSEYWIANRAHRNFSDSLKNILDCWTSGGDLNKEILRQNIDKYYTAMSWHTILSGYGIFPERLVPGSHKAHQFNLSEIDSFLSKCCANFRPAHQLISHR